MATATATPYRQIPNRALTQAIIVIAFGILCTTLAQTHLLGKIPLQNLLKNELHVDRTRNAAFFFWALLPWYFKPLAGILTDAFPLFQTRRRSYILVGSVLAAIAWFAMAVTPHEYRALLAVAIVINTFMTIASTAVGAYIVETAQATASSGRLSSLREFAFQLSFIINGPIAGYLASVSFAWTGVSCGTVMLFLVPVTVLFMREPRRQVDSRQLLGNARTQLITVGTTKTMWAVAGFTVLFYLAPGLYTAIFYKQQNDLHFDTQVQGLLQLLSGVGGAVAAVCYALLCRRFNLRKLLPWCMLFGAAGNLSYLFYSSLAFARAVETFNGFGYTLAEIALVDLAVRATPAGCEGLGFSLMMSVRNFTLYGSDWVGAKLMDQFHFTFSSLVLANGTTTLMTVPMIFLLPRMILAAKDEAQR